MYDLKHVSQLFSLAVNIALIVSVLITKKFVLFENYYIHLNPMRQNAQENAPVVSIIRKVCAPLTNF